MMHRFDENRPRREHKCPRCRSWSDSAAVLAEHYREYHAPGSTRAWSHGSICLDPGSTTGWLHVRDARPYEAAFDRVTAVRKADRRRQDEYVRSLRDRGMSRREVAEAMFQRDRNVAEDEE